MSNDLDVLSKGDYLNDIEDLILTDDKIYTNNTFSLKALNQTLEKLSLINFWNLYQIQRNRLQMQRFDIPFDKFISTTRLTGEEYKKYYPKRYVAYIDYRFIHTELRRKYRNSKYYKLAINQLEIASQPDLFKYNHLVFIEGEYLYTTEVYPLDGKTGIIIDVATSKEPHGIPYERYKEYKERNPIVTVYMVPNFFVTNLNSNKHVIDSYANEIPFDKIPNSNKFTPSTICMTNSNDNLKTRQFTKKYHIDFENSCIKLDEELPYVDNMCQLTFLTFPNMYMVTSVTKENSFFRVYAKMPCPKEQMIVVVSDADGNWTFKHDTIKMYYPNIYEVENLDEGEVAQVYALQEELTVTHSEAYFNEIAKYEEYISLLPKYEDGTVPEVLRHYKPSSFVYSIGDYQSSVYVPSTMNYKAQKLHKTIYENPWVLCTYLDMLNLPTNKFYLDMEKIDLTYRSREDTSMEDTDPDESLLTFEEPHYVFGLNRHYIDTRAYGFRIFIDGLFQKETEYVVKSGSNYYFIYVPVSKVTDTTVIEIERYKLFTVEDTATVPEDLTIPVVELDMSDVKSMGYAREFYVVESDTLKYVPREAYRVEVLYSYAVDGNRWAVIPPMRNIPIENKIRIYMEDESYIGKTLRIGIHRSCSMATGDVYDPEMANQFGDFKYTKVAINNTGGFDHGQYRVFNNGRMILPIQYDIKFTDTFGGDDVIRTACVINAGDQFTIDHVPAQFRLIYYQREIDSIGKKGYVDLDGKIPLPISLKWYDIYVNGRKLHKKNIEILTPTRFYVQGIESRQNLAIVVRDRDPEVFKLPSHDPEFDKVDWNDTIIDDLLDSINGLKDVIDSTKPEIDPDNKFPNIATGVIVNFDAIVFFYEYLMYTFINANWKQITQEIKEEFPDLLDEQCIMHIDGNIGCVEVDEAGGYLIKLIECNERSGDGDMFTDPSVTYEGIGEMQDRFAIRPLNTDNYQYGVPYEFMCDPATGEPALINDDGTVTSISSLVRTNSYIDRFNNNLVLHGMGRADVYQIVFDEDYKVKVYTEGENLLTEDITFNPGENPPMGFCIGLDTTFLIQVDDSKILKLADVDPTVEIKYASGGIAIDTITIKLSRLDRNIITQYGEATLKSITLTGIGEGVRCFVHSLLVAY